MEMIEDLLRIALKNLNDRGWGVYRLETGLVDTYGTISAGPVSELAYGRYFLFPKLEGSRDRKAIDDMIKYVNDLFIFPVATADACNVNLGDFIITPEGVGFGEGMMMDHEYFLELTAKITPFEVRPEQEMLKPTILQCPVEISLPLKRDFSGGGTLVHGVYLIPPQSKIPSLKYLYGALSPEKFMRFPRISETREREFEMTKYNAGLFSVAVEVDSPISGVGSLIYFSVIGEGREESRELFDLIYRTAAEVTVLRPTAVSHQLPRGLVKKHITQHFEVVEKYILMQN
jgi:hypothetical protein